jgi:hypothetical protein
VPLFRLDLVADDLLLHILDMALERSDVCMLPCVSRKFSSIQRCLNVEELTCSN